MRITLNHTSLFIALSSVLLLFSCGQSQWSKDDQDKLLKRCISEGGSKSYCKCYLENAMNEYPNAEDMETLDFESAVELSLGCED